MKAKQYYGDRPCINYIWMLLDRLDKRGLLKPKLRPAITSISKQP